MPLLFQSFYSLVPKIENCPNYFLNKKLPKATSFGDLCQSTKLHLLLFAKKKFASQIKRAIFVTLFAVIFFLLAYYNEIQFHAEEAQNSIMIVLFMPNLAGLKNIKRNVLLEKVHTCK